MKQNKLGDKRRFEMFLVDYFNLKTKKWMQMGCMTYESAKRMSAALRSKHCGPTAIHFPSIY